MPPRYDAPVLQFPVPGCTRFLTRGGTSVRALSDDGETVLKFPLTLDTEHCAQQVAAVARSQMVESHMLLEREKEIHEHLGPRAGILAPLNISAAGTCMPYLKNGDLRTYLQRKWSELRSDQLISWAEEAVERVAFIQSRGVYQCDISARSFLVDNDLSLVLCDFSGSRIGDKEELVGPEASHEKHLRDDQYGTIQGCGEGEVFSIGSLLYEILTGKRPYSDRIDNDIRNLFKQQVFPPTSSLALDTIFRSCWFGEYKIAEEIKMAIQVVRASKEMH